MAGDPIRQLNTGLQQYQQELAGDGLASKRVEIAVVSFGGHVVTNVDFVTADHFAAPNLSPGGDTPMGQAIIRAIDMLRLRKETYRLNGVAFYRPWIFLITDGEPTDNWTDAAGRVAEGERAKAFSFFAVGVQGANVEKLKQISVREPLRLDGLKFQALFQWLSNSQRAVSQSKPGEDVPLRSPAGWAKID
jgi:uncharacterized protein YegL